MSNKQATILLTHSGHDACTFEVVGYVRQSVDDTNLDTVNACLPKFARRMHYLNDRRLNSFDQYRSGEVALS